MVKNQKKSDMRTKEQIKEHSEIEKELAYKLRIASKKERSVLYSTRKILLMENF